MPYSTERDREIDVREIERAPWPVAPNNLFASSAYRPGAFDLTWDDPTNQSLNARFNLLGVNIYRSFDSEWGPFDRITEVPVGATFWRDETDNVLALEEVVTNWVIRGYRGANDIGPRYVFRTQNAPIVLSGSQAIVSNLPTDVIVRVNGTKVKVLGVLGETGEVEIDAATYPEVGTQRLDPSDAPPDNSVVTVSYRYNRNLVKTQLNQRIFYRITSVGSLTLNSTPSVESLVETPLEYATATSNLEIEKRDYIWNEAVRRNAWILQEGGERVKVFLAKTTGIPCGCVQNGHAQGDCSFCYGTSFEDGFEGPYDIIIAPDDAERRIAQRPEGRTVEHSYEVWTGPKPVLSQRDFIVKVDGDRYSIGAVRRPTNRGMVLQQHFNIGHLDEKDARYSVPVYGVQSGRRVIPPVPSNFDGAQITEEVGVPPEDQIRGRTITFENIVG